MNNVITNSKQRVPVKDNRSNRDTLKEELKIYMPVLAGVLFFALLILTSVSHSKLFLADLLTVSFIVLAILIIRTTESRSIAHSIRTKRNINRK